MTQAEAVLLAYLIVWTLAGHWYVLRRWEQHRKHKKASKAAVKAAATRKRNSPSNGRGNVKVKEGKVGPRRPGAVKWRPKKKALQDRVLTAESAWFKLLNDADEVDYNELEMGEAWRPKVTRFDGTAREYAARAVPSDDAPASVED